MTSNTLYALFLSYHSYPNGFYKVNLYVAKLHQPNRLKHFSECLTAVLHLEIRAPPKTQLIITMSSLHHLLSPFSFIRSL